MSEQRKNNKIKLYVIYQNINSETKTNPNILLIVKPKQIQIFNYTVKRGNSIQIKPKKESNKTRKKKKKSILVSHK